MRNDDFDALVPLLPGLDVVAIRKAINHLERQLAELIEIYNEQANVFSALVGIFGAKALHIAGSDGPYLPVHTGGRFSRNEAMPSRESSLVREITRRSRPRSMAAS